MTEIEELKDALAFIDPIGLSYEDWTHVGMALKAEGVSIEVWDEWSRRDSERYLAGDCDKRWMSFKKSGYTGATIFKMAIVSGYKPKSRDAGYALDWDSKIGSEKAILDKSWLEKTSIEEPDDRSFRPFDEIERYIRILFQEDEHVGLVTRSWRDENGKLNLDKGQYQRTAGELLDEMKRYKKSTQDITDVIGTYSDEGAWIRFNPLDGKGIGDENVTAYRYALVEADHMDPEMQLTIVRKLELPIAVLVFSGGKSLHAIVKIDADSYKEYQQRVEYLYKICQKNGLDVDKADKNPSRLSRMPGIIRIFNGKPHKQFIVDSNIGKRTWEEWVDFIESANDDLPDMEVLQDDLKNLPPMAPSLIDGVLRQGHKMLLAGPSKAGKSFALIELCIAIAEGKTWIRWNCTQGKVLYVNLELDRASCLHRFHDVYEAMGLKPKHSKNIIIWNLRGRSTPLDKLAPRLIRRCQKGDFIAVVIDPIYKVLTGDENSATEMGRFSNQFDMIATDLNCAVIYCHHHSKGAQGQKRSMDRASGSGVFARDPDALLDIVELSMTEAAEESNRNAVICRTIEQKIMEYVPEAEISEDQLKSRREMQSLAYENLRQYITDDEIDSMIKEATVIADRMTAWRIDMTLREFPKPEQTDIWFNYPIHHVDDTEILSGLSPEEEMAPWQKGKKTVTSGGYKEKNKLSRISQLEMAFDEVSSDGGDVTVKLLAEEMGIATRTVWRYIKESGKKFKTTRVEGKDSVVERCDNS